MDRAQSRGRRRRVVGVVTSDKMNKTRRVEIQRLVKHPRFGKYIKRRTVCHAHDEKSISRLGDVVELMETRPLSRTKRWRVARIVSRLSGQTENEGSGGQPGRQEQEQES